MERDARKKATAPLSSPDDLRAKAAERFMKTFLPQRRALIFSALREAIRAAAGIVAIETEGKCGPPKRVRLLNKWWRVECVASPDIAGNAGGMPRFRAGQVIVDHMVFGNWRGPQDNYSPEYDDISPECLTDVAEALIRHIDDIFDLARALFMKGGLRRDEIKALLRRKADGGGDDGAAPIRHRVVGSRRGKRIG